MGCFVDTTERDLSVEVTLSQFTPEMCQVVCGSAGYTFAAVQVCTIQIFLSLCIYGYHWCSTKCKTIMTYYCIKKTRNRKPCKKRKWKSREMCRLHTGKHINMCNVHP